MGEYSFTVHVEAPPEPVFDLFTHPDRMHEWVGGVTRITDVSGPRGEAGSSYTVWFGRMASPTRILESERPRRIRGRFGNRLLRGEMEATFESEGDGTLLTQRFRTEGWIPAVMARMFATGSYRGSFRGELNEFARIAKRESRGGSASDGSMTGPNGGVTGGRLARSTERPRPGSRDSTRRRAGPRGS
ncbi:hypothetical protein BH23CHL8_BH23CHL8_21590 [soil metagenome]